MRAHEKKINTVNKFAFDLLLDKTLYLNYPFY